MEIKEYIGKENNLIRLIYGNCMQWMDGIKHYNVGMPDPNYGIGADKPSKKPCTVKQKNGTILKVKQKVYSQDNWDSKPADAKYFDALFSCTDNQIIWGVNYYDYKFGSGRLVWDKLNGESDQYGCEIAYNSFTPNRTDIVHYLWSGMMQGETPSFDANKALRQIGNKKLNEVRIHPCQKPVILYKWILLKYVPKGSTIIDTHGGSFNLAKACWDLGYSLDILENSRSQYDTSVESFEQHIKQLTIF